jgi:hypothetical protein
VKRSESSNRTLPGYSTGTYNALETNGAACHTIKAGTSSLATQIRRTSGPQRARATHNQDGDPVRTRPQDRWSSSPISRPAALTSIGARGFVRQPRIRTVHRTNLDPAATTTGCALTSPSHDDTSGGGERADARAATKTKPPAVPRLLTGDDRNFTVQYHQLFANRGARGV